MFWREETVELNKEQTVPKKDERHASKKTTGRVGS